MRLHAHCDVDGDDGGGGGARTNISRIRGGDDSDANDSGCKLYT